MKAVYLNILAKVALGALLVTPSLTAKAQTGAGCGCKTEVVGIAVGIAAGGAALGIGAYYAIHHGHSLNGCVVTGPGGLELQNQGDEQTYALIGETAAIKPGEHFRVSGKKEKTNAGAPRQFLVEKLAKDYGSCALAPGAR
jgi:hypothetical protein